MDTRMLIALIMFLVTYASLLIFPKYRAYIAVGSGLVFIISQYISVGQALKEIDWNVLMMIAGTMGIVALFIESKMPSYLADLIIEKTPNVKWAILSLSVFAGIVSAFIDNVATVLMIAPIALNIAKKLKISPVPSIIAIAIASNLEGAATLVGDTTSILLGSELNMTFFDFFFYGGKVGLFFIVQVGLFMSTLVLIYVFRKEKQPVEGFEKTQVTDFVPTILLAMTIVLLVVASFLRNHLPSEINGYICMGLMFIGIGYSAIRKKSWKVFPSVLKEIDFFTILLLAGLFIVIGGIKEAGVVRLIGTTIAEISGGNIFLVYTIIVWASVLLSAFIDNIPYIATMLPLIGMIVATPEFAGVDPALLYFGLLIGATLGGNLTPIGASANITGLGILRKEGYEVSAKTFMKISVPYTLAAVTTGYLLVWFIWGM